MDSTLKKPRLVFFQWKHDSLPEFLLLHIALHIKCLREFFEVIVINKDCDYKHICEKYNPDLTLFESGYKSTVSKRIEIKNTESFPHIPKLGLHNGDGWCECRVGFISDMEKWGINTFFTISVTTAEYTPKLAENFFVWPNFIDAEVYNDYKQSKVIPFMFNGSMISLYPWRTKIFNIISKKFPSLIFPHGGYDKQSGLMIHGEQYARTINSSLFVPACGTITNEIVRKHFEIPGCRSCLITEKTPALTAAGFVDMKNCLFVDESNVLDKVSKLLNNREKLRSITEAGFELVHSQHTLKQRDQILQWFNLNKIRKDGEKIIQLGPFLPLKIVRNSSHLKNGHIYSNGLYLQELNRGSELLQSKNYDAAELCFLQCLKYIPWMSEPKVKLAICCLFKGDANQAVSWIKQPVENVIGQYEYSEPDPVEWTYYLISLLCEGKLNEAAVMSNQFDLINHIRLNWTRFAIEHLQTTKNRPLKSELPNLKQTRSSIHQLPDICFEDWLSEVCTMLRSCNQTHFANVLAELKNGSPTFLNNRALNRRTPLKCLSLELRIRCTHTINKVFAKLKIPNRRTGLPSTRLIDYVIRIFRWTKQGKFGMSFFK